MCHGTTFLDTAPVIPNGVTSITGTLGEPLQGSGHWPVVDISLLPVWVGSFTGTRAGSLICMLSGLPSAMAELRSGKRTAWATKPNIFPFRPAWLSG